MALIAEGVMPLPHRRWPVNRYAGRCFVILLLNPEDNPMAKTHDDFLKKMKAQYDELNQRWSVERSKLEAKAQQVSSEARQKFEDEWESLDRLRKQMREKIIDLEVAAENTWVDFKDEAGDAWKDVREGTEKAWGSLSEGFKKAASRF
jgi:hypothetical protein